MNSQVTTDVLQRTRPTGRGNAKNLSERKFRASRGQFIRFGQAKGAGHRNYCRSSPGFVR